jgi:hypothetical protein
VLQECSRPAAINDQCVYFPTTAKKGVGVITQGAWRVAGAPVSNEVLDSAYPVEVSGPRRFNMLVVWAQRSPTYVRAVFRALDYYGDFLRVTPSLIIGDFNSHARWDHLHPNASHTQLVNRLDQEFSMVSAFHAFVAPEGSSESPTYFHQWNEARPYHIDYCFIPKSWVTDICSVEVGNYSDWVADSDHRPLMIEFSNVGNRPSEHSTSKIFRSRGNSP